MKAKKILSMLLAVLMIATMLPIGTIIAGAAAADVTSGWSGRGTERRPYTISNSYGWAVFMIASYNRTFEGQYIVLANDIDLSDLGDHISAALKYVTDEGLQGDTEEIKCGWATAGQANWVVGSTTKSHFRGNFDGKGYTIKNYDINTIQKSTPGMGLFGYVGAGGVLQNFTLDDSSMSCPQQDNRTLLIAACTASGQTNATITVKNINITNSSVYLHSQTGTQRFLAGIIGTVYGNVTLDVENVKVENCSLENNQYNIGFLGRVSGENINLNFKNVDILDTTFTLKSKTAKDNHYSAIGALFAGPIASTEAAVESLTIEDCDVRVKYNIDHAVNPNKDYGIGGLVGMVNVGSTLTIKNSTVDLGVFYSNTECAKTLGMGGVVGYIYGEGTTTIENVSANVYVEVGDIYQSGVKTGVKIGGIVGASLDAPTLSNCKSDLYVSDAIGSSLVKDGFVTIGDADYKNINGTETGTSVITADTNTYAKLIKAGIGNGTEASPFVIDSVDDWKLYIAVSRMNSFADTYYTINEYGETVSVSYPKFMTVSELTIAEVENIFNWFKTTFGTDYVPSGEGSMMNLTLGEKITVNVYPAVDSVLANLSKATGEKGIGAKLDDAAPVKFGEYNKVSKVVDNEDATKTIGVTYVLYTSDTEYIEFGQSFDVSAVGYGDLLGSTSGNNSEEKSLGKTLANYIRAIHTYYSGTNVAPVAKVVDETGTSTNVTYNGAVIDLKTSSKLRFEFALAAGVDATTLAVEGGTVVVDGDKVYVDVEVQTLDFAKDVEITLDGVTAKASIASYCDIVVALAEAAEAEAPNKAALTAMSSLAKTVVAYKDALSVIFAPVTQA